MTVSSSARSPLKHFLAIPSEGEVKRRNSEPEFVASHAKGDVPVAEKRAAVAPVTIAFNGKFFGAHLNGVHRVAEQIIAATDALITEQSGQRADYAIVTRYAEKLPSYRNISCVPGSSFACKLPKIAWEQFYFPFARRRDFILNLCNLGPLFHRNSATMIHDAQVYSTPESYSLFFRLRYKLLFFFIGRRHKIIFTVSEFSKQELVRYGVAHRDKIVVVHNGCDHVLKVPADEKPVAALKLEPARYVLALANIQKHKNVSVLLEAFARDELKDVPLVLFGPDSRAQFEAAGHMLPPNVKFAGRVSDAELVGLMKSAGVLAFPSLTEGFGLPPLEAMALGCPVIAAPKGALPEVCGDAAFYADPFSPAAWSEQIRTVLGNGAVRESLIARGRRHASRFTWRRAAQKLSDAIRALA